MSESMIYRLEENERKLAELKRLIRNCYIRMILICISGLAMFWGFACLLVDGALNLRTSAFLAFYSAIVIEVVSYYWDSSDFPNEED